jgi:cell division septal protein FtsQ
MARKKKKKINPSLFKYALITLVGIAAVFVMCYGIYRFARESSLFTIKQIKLEEPVSFINKRIFRKIEGENIFQIDLNRLEERLTYRYPQISDLKVLRLFPDTILITARKRLPFMQTMADNVLVTLDDEGFVISTKSKRDEVIPFVVGLDGRKVEISLGKRLRSPFLNAVLLILKRFQANENLAAYEVEKVKVESLSRIHLYLSNGLRILMDANRVSRALRDLSLFLSSKKIDIDRTQYIDLRYKDIIVKEKAL